MIHILLMNYLYLIYFNDLLVAHFHLGLICSYCEEIHLPKCRILQRHRGMSQLS